jgi:hypothetical protein
LRDLLNNYTECIDMKYGISQVIKETSHKDKKTLMNVSFSLRMNIIFSCYIG